MAGIQVCMNEIGWLANELEHPTHNLQLAELLQKVGPIIQMKNDCKKVFEVADEPRNSDEESGLATRLNNFLQQAVEHTKTGQEGIPVPGDLSIVLGKALDVVLHRLTH